MVGGSLQNLKMRMKSVQRNNYSLLIVIPCFNEEKTIHDVIKKIPRSFINVKKVQILVVDDGSSDKTSRNAELAGAKVIKHKKNAGVGRAFQTAVELAVEEKFDILVNIDGDGQFDPRDIGKLIQPIVDGKADMATASRFTTSETIPNMPALKYYGNKLMANLISYLLQRKFSDVACGFRAYNRNCLLQLNLNGMFTYTQETFLDLSSKFIHIMEIPIKVKYFNDRRSRVANNLFKYGAKTLKIIFSCFRDFYPLRFFWGIAAFFFSIGLFFALVFFGHFLYRGIFQGFIFAGLLSGFFILLSCIFFLIGLVAEMLDRIRWGQDKILYLLKKEL